MKKKCEVCHKQFETNYPWQKCCSKKCQDEGKRVRQRKYRLEHNPHTNIEPMKKKCVVCGTEFETFRPQQVCCKNQECHKERHRIASRVYMSERKDLKREKAKNKHKRITMGEIKQMGYKNYAEYQIAQTLRMIKENKDVEKN